KSRPRRTPPSCCPSPSNCSASWNEQHPPRPADPPIPPPHTPTQGHPPAYRDRDRPVCTARTPTPSTRPRPTAHELTGRPYSDPTTGVRAGPTTGSVIRVREEVPHAQKGQASTARRTRDPHRSSHLRRRLHGLPRPARSAPTVGRQARQPPRRAWATQ